MELGDDPFTEKMQKVRHVLVDGEGFLDAEVGYELEAGRIVFSAPGAKSVTMRRAEFDVRTHFEVAFFVATRMRRPLPAPVKPAAR